MGQKRNSQCQVVGGHCPSAGFWILCHYLKVWSKNTYGLAGNYWWRLRQWNLPSCQGWRKPLVIPLSDQWQSVYIDFLMQRHWHQRPGLWLFCWKVYCICQSSEGDVPVLLPLLSCTIVDVFVDDLAHYHPVMKYCGSCWFWPKLLSLWLSRLLQVSDWLMVVGIWLSGNA